ncbi:RagB/SusD family nutrient uptake outer membrane protein [Rapidithrix thailandica]|uniref:RagB/SusD family nutrient uptake outer membrane protein n=1 Tax=Rapidithrix thailandica TaxID=413964 RepID=A0AAW9SAE8_9BACT
MKFLKYILCIPVLGLLVSCEDFLDRPPLDAIGTDSYWKTAGDLENYVMQFYPKLPSHGTGAGMPIEDANSDNMILAVANATLNGERPITTGNWIGDWDEIRSLNIFFDNYQKVEDGFDTYKHFVGEAHFFKAWFYFRLLRVYGDVPWYAKELTPGDEDLTKARDPRTLVADSVLAHIDKAIEYLDPRSDAGNSRLNKEAALAFKTRVALFEGTWQKYHEGTPFASEGADPAKYFQACVDAAEELINGSYTKGIYNTGSPDWDYYTLFGLDNMSQVEEVLLYRISNSGESMGNNVQFYTTVRTNEMGITWSLVSSYLGKNGEPYDYLGLASTTKGNAFLSQVANDCDPRLKATVWIPGDLRVASSGEVFDKPFIDKGGEEVCPTGFQVKKFSNPGSPGAGGVWGGNSETGYILFRYAEVLLNYAEAKYEMEGTVAYDALNLLRQRAGMPDFSINPQGADLNPVDYGYPVTDALYEIRRERRVELALEGQRQEDYQRWAAHGLFKGKKPLGYPFDASEFPGFTPPLDPNGLIDYFANQLPSGFQFKENRDYLDDIPQTELTLNPNLEQNPGWE